MTFTVAVTGHRPAKLGGFDPLPTTPKGRLQQWIRDELEGRLVALQDEHGAALQAISGMALGVDQWFAEACRSLSIPFIAAIPFDGQETPWPWPARAKYAELLADAREVVVVSGGGYGPWKMQARNRWMVDRADILLAVWDGSSGGTAHCVKYAMSQDRKIDRIQWTPPRGASAPR